MRDAIKTITQSLEILERWIIKHDYKGYEPFDGLSSLLRPLTLRNEWAERILQQAIRQCPVNLRPLLGVKMLDSTKGRGYIAWGYLKMHQCFGSDIYRAGAEKCLNWLIDHKSPFYEKASWGNEFDYASRGGKLAKDEPTIVWTSLIGQAFLDAYELLKDHKYYEMALSVCAWILSLPREKTANGTCISYVALGQNSIHNSNMLGAAMLARTARISGNKEDIALAKEAIKYSCADQHQNGAWYYGKAAKYHWVDNFHTGYNLDSLKCYIDNTQDLSFEENLMRGYRYYRDTFIEKDGRPKYYNHRAYPIDIQCASQAIDTLANFEDRDKQALETAMKVAVWTIENMQDPDGHFYYRILPFMKAKAPMIHWGQATMFKALAHLLYRLKD